MLGVSGTPVLDAVGKSGGLGDWPDDKLRFYLIVIWSLLYVALSGWLLMPSCFRSLLPCLSTIYSWPWGILYSSLKFSSVQFFCLFGVKLQPDRFTIKGNNPQNRTELPKTAFLQFKTGLNQLLTAYYNRLWSITIITCYNHLFIIFSCLLLTKCTNN